MNVQMPGPSGAMETQALNVAFEVHFYQSGRKKILFGHEGARPSWLPPSDWTGFRQEVTLDRDEYAVEATRFLVDGRYVFWLAVYKADVDTSFGNRDNHSGIGMWVSGGHIENIPFILNVLQQFTNLIEQKKDMALWRSELESFAASGNVEKAVRSFDPSKLLGCGYSLTENHVHVSDYFYVDSSNDHAWQIASWIAESIEFLPGISTGASRVLILVGQRPAVPEAIGGGRFQAVDSSSWTKSVAGRAGAALRGAAERYRSAVASNAEIEQRANVALAELETKTSQIVDLQNRIEYFEERLGEGDVGKWLMAIEKRFHTVETSLDSSRAQIGTVTERLERIATDTSAVKARLGSLSFGRSGGESELWTSTTAVPNSNVAGGMSAGNGSFTKSHASSGRKRWARGQMAQVIGTWALGIIVVAAVLLLIVKISDF